MAVVTPAQLESKIRQVRMRRWLLLFEVVLIDL